MTITTRSTARSSSPAIGNIRSPRCSPAVLSGLSKNTWASPGTSGWPASAAIAASTGSGSAGGAGVASAWASRSKRTRRCAGSSPSSASCCAGTAKRLFQKVSKWPASSALTPPTQSRSKSTKLADALRMK